MSKGIGTRNNAQNLRFQTSALRAVQEATESYIVGLMEDMNLCLQYMLSMSQLCPKICNWPTELGVRKL